MKIMKIKFLSIQSITYIVLIIIQSLILISKSGFKKWFTIKINNKFISFIINIIFIIILELFVVFKLNIISNILLTISIIVNFLYLYIVFNYYEIKNTKNATMDKIIEKEKQYVNDIKNAIYRLKQNRENKELSNKEIDNAICKAIDIFPDYIFKYLNINTDISGSQQITDNIKNYCNNRDNKDYEDNEDEEDNADGNKDNEDGNMDNDGNIDNNGYLDNQYNQGNITYLNNNSFN